jgi:hypothetical protein
MRRFALSALLAILVLSVVPTFTQTSTSTQPPVRDPQAFALLQAAAAALARMPPGDSMATGSVTLAAGSTTDQGTIRVLTKGTSQTRFRFRPATPAGRSLIPTHQLAAAMAPPPNNCIWSRPHRADAFIFPIPSSPTCSRIRTPLSLMSARRFWVTHRYSTSVAGIRSIPMLRLSFSPTSRLLIFGSTPHLAYRRKSQLFAEQAEVLHRGSPLQ